MKIETKKDVFEKKPKKIRDIKTARRFLANLIYEFQQNNITDQKVKTLAYLLIKYAELYKVESLEDIELRLQKLEEAK